MPSDPMPTAQQPDLAALFETVCRDAVRETGSTRASVWYFEPDGSLTCQSLFDARDGSLTSGTTLSHATHAAYLDAIRSLGIVMAADARSNPATACFNSGYFPENDIHSLLDFLIADRDGRPAAVLCCEQCRAPRSWSGEDIASLQRLAARLSETFRYRAGTAEQRALFTSNLPFGEQPLLMDAAIYWSATRGARQMPFRADISPIDMPRRLLPHLVIAELEDRPFGVRFRLAGTAMVDTFGQNLAGKTTADVMRGDYRVYVEDLFRSVRDTRSPVYSESTFRWDAGGWRHTRRLMLPLATDDPETVRQVLIAQVWPRIADDRQGRERAPIGAAITADRIEQGLSQGVTLPRLDRVNTEEPQQGQ